MRCFSVKDPGPKRLHTRVVYKFVCTGCNAYFIGETIFTFNIREKVTPSWSWKWSLFSSITPCMFNSQVSLPFILVDIWKFVEVHHGCLKQNWLHDFKLTESTCLIRWPMRRLFSRVVKYAEWENPVTTTKASSRMKNDTCMPFIVSTWAEFVNASKKTSVFPHESQLPSFNNNVLLIMLIILLLISLGSRTAINEFKYYGFSGPRWTSVIGDQSRTQILPCNCNYNRKRSRYETKTSHYLSPEGGGEDFNRGSPTKAWRTIIKATCTPFIVDNDKEFIMIMIRNLYSVKTIISEGVVWSNFGIWKIPLAAAFWSFCKRSSWYLGRPKRSALQ